MIYMIPEEKKPISSCELESESLFKSNSNSDNDDNKNNDSSSIQNGNKNYNNSNSNLNPKQYITLPDLSKEQELKWFSNNDESIMPKYVHDIDTGFDLRYPEKNAIKLEPHSHTSKKEINIKGGIIDTEYVENIIAMLQNNSEKTYIIEPNKKIAQAIFLPLMKIVQLMLVGNRKKLGITVRGIQGFGSIDRINVPVNMAEEEIINKGEIISTHQLISILPYD
ncbi:hypothetical protein G9A89_020690 [Geosiphon pyriformis]|nr:hypothetical protein G9A89_020690 [Geosiphon pyriformis]